MGKILGLDLGTNSIGWALVDDEKKEIIGMGSRIIPMGNTKIEYEQGAGISRNAQRRDLRSSRKNNKRFKLRRNKLLYVLNELDCLPDQFVFKNGIPNPDKIQELELLPIPKGSLQLDAITHYEKRVKALTEFVTKKDFGKILYGFNSLRGYAGGGEDDDKDDKMVELDGVDGSIHRKNETIVCKIQIMGVEISDATFKSKRDKNIELNKYKITFSHNDEIKEALTELQELKVGDEEEFELRIKRLKTGESITIHLPNKTSWRKDMEGNEKLLKDRKWTIGELNLAVLRDDKYKRVRNKVFLRHRYQEEFDRIWNKQAEYHKYLVDCPKEKLLEIATYLFPGPSESQRKLRDEAIKGGLYHIIRNQIIYYQRPLKSQTDLISRCSFEKAEPVIAISHPLFQEFRCWKQINNLQISTKVEQWNEKKQKAEYRYLETPLSKEQKIAIYNKLISQRNVGYGEICRILEIKDVNTVYLNGLSPKDKFVGCETVYSISKILGYVPDNTTLLGIWDALYNKTGSEYDLHSEKISALIQWVSEEKAFELAQKVRFVRKYGSLSEVAIKKILPLMQCKIPITDSDAHKKFNAIKQSEVKNDSDDIENYVKEYVYKNDELDNGMMEYMALSFIYGNHTQDDIKIQITDYHQIVHKERGLRNPIVEQLCNESMQVIKSLWKEYKLDTTSLEIKVELARDLKNSAAEREKIYKGQKQNRALNEAIKQRLLELKIYSADNVERYKIWRKQSIEMCPKFKDPKAPTKDEIEKLRIWEEQKCVSPYTMQPIPLSKLFDKGEYDIDHIIPKTRFFDDSSANKVVCEQHINKEKSNRY